jgi:hypothetical protein
MMALLANSARYPEYTPLAFVTITPDSCSPARSDGQDFGTTGGGDADRAHALEAHRWPLHAADRSIALPSTLSVTSMLPRVALE